MRAGCWRICAAGLLVTVLVLAGCGVAKNVWQTIGPGNAQINTLASDPHIRGIIFAGGSDGTTYVARGDRSGVFVTSEKSPGTGPVNVIFPNPYSDGVVYAGTSGGFYASSDYGVNYRAQNGGLPTGANITAITTGAAAQTVFASVSGKGLYTSADGGKSWNAVTPSPATATSVALPLTVTVQSLFWDAGSKSLYLAVSGGGAGLYVSHDNGASWSVASAGMPARVDVYALAAMASGGISPSGRTLYAGTSAGLFALNTSGSGTPAWQPLGVGLPARSIYSLAVYPSVPGLLYAGTDQTIYVSSDGGRQWKKVAEGLAHAVPAIVVVPGEHIPTVTFAAAGQIVRYPAGATNEGGILSTLLLLIIVGLAAWYVLARYRIVPGIKEVRRRLVGGGAQRGSSLE